METRTVASEPWPSFTTGPVDVIDSKLETCFAPAERASQEDLDRQVALVRSVPLLSQVLDCLPNVALVLNAQRQIVLCNKALHDLLGVSDFERIKGQRAGESFSCVHARESEGGCGTTEHCAACGAACPILAAQEQGTRQIRECRMLRHVNGRQEAIDLSVSASLIPINSEHFTLVCISDITDSKRKSVLERVFFHDVRNTAAALVTSASMMRSGDFEDEEFVSLVTALGWQLLSQIDSQQQLLAAERGDLRTAGAVIDVPPLVQQLVEQYRGDKSARDKTIRIEPGACPDGFASDPVLLQRVLGNLLRNALEASRRGETVTLGWQTTRDGLRFWVNNPAVMPRAVQLQLFQRSFSTKGTGRGVGTYSVKLLTETYLKGRVWFESNAESGTTFVAEYPLTLT
jgi:K+-sensing histidine kinase KdpD